MTSSWLIDPRFVATNDTVPCGTEVASAVRRIIPPRTPPPIPGPPIMGPPMFVTDTLTTVPGRFGTVHVVWAEFRYPPLPVSKPRRAAPIARVDAAASNDDCECARVR